MGRGGARPAPRARRYLRCGAWLARPVWRELSAGPLRGLFRSSHLLHGAAGQGGTKPGRPRWTAAAPSVKVRPPSRLGRRSDGHRVTAQNFSRLLGASCSHDPWCRRHPNPGPATDGVWRAGRTHALLVPGVVGCCCAAAPGAAGAPRPRETSMDRHSSYIFIWLQLELCAMAVLLTKGVCPPGGRGLARGSWGGALRTRGSWGPGCRAAAAGL